MNDETKINSEGDISDVALSIYKPPFNFKYGFIFDANYKMVADDCGENAITRIRGWGHISYMDSPEKLQDEVGVHIAKALTEYWEKYTGDYHQK